MAAEETGPNDMSCIVWAISKFFLIKNHIQSVNTQPYRLETCLCLEPKIFFYVSSEYGPASSMWTGMGFRCDYCDDIWLWNKNYFITSTVTRSLINYDFFDIPVVGFFWECLAFILLELTSVSFSGYWPKIKTEKGQKVSKKLADLAWTRKSHLYK